MQYITEAVQKRSITLQTNAFVQDETKNFAFPYRPNKFDWPQDADVLKNPQRQSELTEEAIITSKRKMKRMKSHVALCTSGADHSIFLIASVQT